MSSLIFCNEKDAEGKDGISQGDVLTDKTLLMITVENISGDDLHRKH